MCPPLCCSYNNLLALGTYIPMSSLTGEFSELLSSELPSREALLAIGVTCVLGVCM